MPQDMVQQQGGGQEGRSALEIAKELLSQIPIDQLIALAQLPPEQLVNKLKELLTQRGIPEEELMPYVKVILQAMAETIQEQTGRPITDIDGSAGGGASLSSPGQGIPAAPGM